MFINSVNIHVDHLNIGTDTWYCTRNRIHFVGIRKLVGQQKMTRPNNRPRSKGVGQCHNLTHETEND